MPSLEEEVMPLYLTRFSYTPETWARLIKKPEDRRVAAQPAHRRGDTGGAREGAIDQVQAAR
jgi:hypothetical protein